jgi:outer membrane protein
MMVGSYRVKFSLYILWLGLLTCAVGRPGLAATVEEYPITPGAELTLKQAIIIALKYHPRRKQRIYEANAAREKIGEARALMGPQLHGVGEEIGATANPVGETEYIAYPFYNMPTIHATNASRPAPGRTGNQFDWYNNFLAGYSLDQFLFDFGRHRGFVKQREFETQAAEYRQRLTDLDLIFEVSRRYFAVLRAKQLVRVYEKAIEQRRFHLHEAQVKAAAKLRPDVDIYVAEAELQRAELRLVDARYALADAKVALDNAMGLSDLAPSYELADVLTYGKITDTMRGLLQLAYRTRPDIKMFRALIEAMGAQVVQYRSDYFPSAGAFSESATMGTTVPKSPNFAQPANNWALGIVVHWPIFNSFLTTHQLQEAKLSQKAIEYGLADLNQRVIYQVKTAFLNWQASIERIEHAEKALAASRVELELVEKRYEAGLTNIVFLEDAERHYTDDDAQYANSLYDFSLAKAEVDHATGRALDIESQ